MNIGDILTNKNGEAFEILKESRHEKRSKYFIIKFIETGNIQEVASNLIASLRVRDKSKPIYYGVGYMKSSNGELVEENHWIRSAWEAMLSRCYSEKIKAYADVEVCEEWHNFYNFQKWYKENYPDVYTSKQLCLDKDLFAQDNKKIYSPATCCFLPSELNTFIKSLKIKDGIISQSIPARTVYVLSQMIEKYSPILSEKVITVLGNYSKEYIDKFNKQNRLNFNKLFHDAINKVDISKVKITAFVKYGGKLFEFSTIGEIKKFVSDLEKSAIIENNPNINPSYHTFIK